MDLEARCGDDDDRRIPEETDDNIRTLEKRNNRSRTPSFEFTRDNGEVKLGTVTSNDKSPEAEHGLLLSERESSEISTWAITINSRSESFPDELIEYLKRNGRYVKWLTEVGSCVHMHVLLDMKKRKKYMTIINDFKKMGLEGIELGRPWSRNKWKLYCSSQKYKEKWKHDVTHEKFIQEGEIGTWVPSSSDDDQRYRKPKVINPTKFELCYDYVLKNQNKSFDELLLANAMVLFYQKPMYTLWQTLQRKRLKSIEFKRTVKVIILWGKTNTGKTDRAYNFSRNYYTVEAPNSKTNPLWFDGYSQEPTLIIDEFTDWIPINVLLRLLQGYYQELQIKSNFICAQWNVVLITSNIDPTKWFTFAKHETKEALYRRFTHIFHFKSREEIVFTPSIEIDYQDIMTLAEPDEIVLFVKDFYNKKT